MIFLPANEQKKITQKFEIRSTKSETNSNVQNVKFQTGWVRTLSFSLSDLVGVFLTGLTLMTQISGLFFKLTGIAVLGSDRAGYLRK